MKHKKSEFTLEQLIVKSVLYTLYMDELWINDFDKKKLKEWVEKRWKKNLKKK